MLLLEYPDEVATMTRDFVRRLVLSGGQGCRDSSPPERRPTAPPVGSGLGRDFWSVRVLREMGVGMRDSPSCVSPSCVVSLHGREYPTRGLDSQERPSFPQQSQSDRE